MAQQTSQPGSSSLGQPDYWWYRARTSLLEEVFGRFLGTPRAVLDVGSADAPSVGWMHGSHRRVSLDLHPGGLVPGEGVCGSATDLPFRDGSFDVVAAFDVVEHCEDDARAVSELLRVLVPGGRLMVSVPAYGWAWSDHDVQAGHYRRYTRRQVVRLVEGAGATVTRSTYAFCAVFPLFVAERVRRKLRRSPGPDEPSGPGSASRLTPVSPTADRVLMGLSRAERRVIGRRDLPFGSSVFVAAVKP